MMEDDNFQRRALLEKVSGISNATLKDIDWNVKIVMSSDKISNLRQPLCTVEFQLETEDGPKTNSIEMDKQELKQFLDALESANKSLNHISSS